MYCRQLKFPHRAVVLLALVSDGACTSLNGHSARKVHCCFKYDAIKPEVKEKKKCEDTDCLKAALGSGLTRLQVMVASSRSVSRGSSEAVTLPYLIPWPSTQPYRVKTQVSKY